MPFERKALGSLRRPGHARGAALYRHVEGRHCRGSLLRDLAAGAPGRQHCILLYDMAASGCRLPAWYARQLRRGLVCAAACGWWPARRRRVTTPAVPGGAEGRSGTAYDDFVTVAEDLVAANITRPRGGWPSRGSQQRRPLVSAVILQRRTVPRRDTRYAAGHTASASIAAGWCQLDERMQRLTSRNNGPGSAVTALPERAAAGTGCSAVLFTTSC